MSIGDTVSKYARNSKDALARAQMGSFECKCAPRSTLSALTEWLASVDADNRVNELNGTSLNGQPRDLRRAPTPGDLA